MKEEFQCSKSESHLQGGIYLSLLSIKKDDFTSRLMWEIVFSSEEKASKLSTYISRSKIFAVRGKRQSWNLTLVSVKYCNFLEIYSIPFVQVNLSILEESGERYRCLFRRLVKSSLTSLPIAIKEPWAPIALGWYDGFLSKTLWFERNASMTPISTTNTVESPATAIDFGCALVETAVGLSMRTRVIECR